MYTSRAKCLTQKRQLLSKLLSFAVFILWFPVQASWGFFDSKDVVSEEVLSRLASTDKLEISNTRIIIDNDESFRKKIEYIRSAQAGDKIDMIYYIYASDFTSSVISYELIEAAKRGVKVRLLLDYLTNFKNIDNLLMLEAYGVSPRGEKNIQVRLFGKPSSKIISDSVFLTTNCETGFDGCIERKKQKSVELVATGNGTDYLSRLFLGGLMAKNGSALKVSVVEGQGIDGSQFKGDEPMSEEELRDLKKLGQLMFRAKIKGELSAKFQLFVAMIAYADEIMPIYNLVTTSLPLSSDEDAVREWTYLSDYTHHKMMLVTSKSGGQFILGGRNVEDSYHLKVNDMSKDSKYIFMDTELATNLNPESAKQINASFDSLWNFKVRVSTLDEADAVTEIDSLSSIESVVQAVTICKTQSGLLQSVCLEKNIDAILTKNGFSRSARIQNQYALMLSHRDTYNHEHKRDVQLIDTWSLDLKTDSLTEADLKSAEVYYIENLPFSKKNENERQFGASLLNPSKSNKNITALLLKGLEQTCRVSSASHPQRVILHNAYFFPSPAIVRAFGNLINGNWPCKNVKVMFITNSYETTDLFPVNGVASMQVKALFDASQVLKNTDIKAKANGAQIEYYEYGKVSDSDARSLHTKLAILGDDVILGSANLDMRSYSMDTNNGVYIHGAKEFSRSYAKYIDKMIAGQILSQDGRPRFLLNNRTSELMKPKDAAVYRDENIDIFKYVSSKFSFAKKLFANEDFVSWLKSTMDFIYATTLSSLDVDLTIPSDRSLKLWGESCDSRHAQKQMCIDSRRRDQKRRRNMWEDQLQSLFQTI